jgi:hypothetical protein
MPEMVRAFGWAPTAKWVGCPKKSAAAGGPAVGEQRPFPPELGRGRKSPATFSGLRRAPAPGAGTCSGAEPMEDRA